MQAEQEVGLDLHQVAEIWREGSVVRSRLLDLTSNARGENSSLTGIAPYVEDSGEGCWTVAEAIDRNPPAPVITLTLLERLRSRDYDSFADTSCWRRCAMSLAGTGSSRSGRLPHRTARALRGMAATAFRRGVRIHDRARRHAGSPRHWRCRNPPGSQLLLQSDARVRGR